MQPFTVVLFQGDSRLSQCLVASLCSSFHSVHEVRSLDELQTSIARHRVAVAIVDMEIASLADVEQLSHTFPEVRIVCTHRLADEAMWAAALNAGAADMCPSCDTPGILRAALPVAAQAHSVAA